MASSDPGRRFIVGIGVGEYDLPQLQLPQVAGDVEKITAWFERHPRLAHERALPLLSKNPTWEAMQKGLRDWLAERNANDVIVIYIAAHADYEAGRSYLFGSNTPQRRLAGAAMEAQTLGAMLGQFLVHNVLIIIDACVAGRLASDIQRASEDAVYESNTRDLSRAWAQVLLCSTFGRDPALDGRFAQAFIQVVNSEKWTGTTQPWIDIDQLLRGINEELRSIAVPQVAERRIWGPSAAELIPNPHFAARTLGTLIAEGELAAHFDPSSRGVSGGEAGRFFSGRTPEMRRIAAWLRRADADGQNGTLLVLTGSPGSGKSALLSRAVVLSDPSLREHAGDLSALPADALPPVGAFGGVVWCHNKSLRQVVGEIGQRFGRSVDSAQGLLEAANGQRLTLAIDALDEALPGEAVAIARQVIAPLAIRPGIHILVATRRQPVRGPHDTLDLPGCMGADPAHTMVLDDAIDRFRDMRDYVSARLCAGTSMAAAGYRADTDLAQRVSQRVATAAGSSFLVAAIAARTLSVSETLADADTLILPGAVGEAMAAYIERLPRPQRVRDVLRALAWANGAGLPWGDLWPRLATALASVSRTEGHAPCGPVVYDDADVQAALDAAGDLVVESVEYGGPVYRLFHEALAEHLRRDTPVSAAHTAIADTFILQATGQPWTAVHPYIVANLTAHLAGATDRTDTLIQLVCDPLWERARRTQTRGATQWLDDVDLVIRLLAKVSTQDLRQVGLCVLYGRKLATAPVPVLEVLARAGQLQRAERMAGNLDNASDRVRAHCMLATCYAQVSDLDAANRCLAQANHAAEVLQGVFAPMALNWLSTALLNCKQAAQARAAARSALDIALKFRPGFVATGDIPHVPNALFRAALALRRVGDPDGLSSLRARLAELIPADALTLQLAGVLGEVGFLRLVFDKLKAACNTGEHIGIHAGYLALALAEAGMITELDELVAIVPPQDAIQAGEANSQKRYARALAIVGRMDDALLVLDDMEETDDRIRAALHIAELAERDRQRDVLDRLAERVLAWSAPDDNTLDALVALVLSIAARHEAALTIVEDLMRRPQAAADPARLQIPPIRPLAPNPPRIADEQTLSSIEQMLQDDGFDEALQCALAIGQTEGSASHNRGGALARTPGNLPATRAAALKLLVPYAPDPRRALALWLEALRTARLAGHLAVREILKSGKRVVNVASAGKTWKSLADEVARLERRWDLENFVEQYDTLRSAFDSGLQRTARMSNLMLVPKRQGSGWSRKDIQDVISDDPAKRVFVLGLMRGNLALMDPRLVIEVIARSNSAFEQFHALKLATQGLSAFDVGQQSELVAALTKELASDGSGQWQFNTDSSRRELAEKLLVRLQMMAN